MKNVLNYTLAVIFVMAFGLFSCSMVSEDNTAEPNLDLTLAKDGNVVSMNSAENEANCFNFSSTELATVGVLHNEYCLEVLRENNFSDCGECQEEIVQAFLALDLDVSGLGMSYEELISASVETYNLLRELDFDILNWSNHPFSQPAFDYIASVVSTIEAIDNYDNFVLLMDGMSAAINTDPALNCSERELLIGSIQVAVNSALLWTPVELGGLGIMYNGDTTLRPWWQDAIIGDYASSASYFGTIGVVGAVTGSIPVVGSAILVGWGASAAFGSIGAAIASSNTN